MTRPSYMIARFESTLIERSGSLTARRSYTMVQYTIDTPCFDSAILRYHRSVHDPFIEPRRGASRVRAIHTWRERSGSLTARSLYTVAPYTVDTPSYGATLAHDRPVYDGYTVRTAKLDDTKTIAPRGASGFSCLFLFNNS